nr:DUF2971 domain-containing protein [uncultured Halomonas sp.]
MILYKYMSEAAAKSILKNRSIGFSKPDTFNDPYELKAAYPPQGDNPLDLYFDGVRSWGKQYIWSNTSGVLCLTRNPLNALMWAHYGDEHQGVVLGIDAEQAGFFDVQRCLVPAQFGNVIYTHTRPTNALTSFKGANPILVGHTHHYPAGHEEKLQRIFLQKPACWAYEEEVRVVKCLSDRKDETNQSGTFIEIELPNKTLYCYRLPDGAIKEVYWGMRHPALQSISAAKDGLHEYCELCPELSVNGCQLSRATWDIDSFDVSALVAERGS